jgi:hypothetical protein
MNKIFTKVAVATSLFVIGSGHFVAYGSVNNNNNLNQEDGGKNLEAFNTRTQLTMASELAPSLKTLGEATFPKEYLQKNVQGQLKDYDKVYTACVTPNQPHIIGLFNILERGFSLIYSHLQVKPASAVKDGAMLALEKLYSIVSQKNQKETFNVQSFYSANSSLAIIVDSVNAECAIPDSIYDFTSQSQWEILPVVIYSNPDFMKHRTFISYGTFVNQYLKSPVCRWMYQLEPKYKEIMGNKSNSKAMPHYGLHGTTQRFFAHDNFHQFGHDAAIDGKLKEISLIQEKLLEDKNKSVMLTNALFYLIHENQKLYFSSVPFYRFIHGVSYKMTSEIENERNIYYKETIRDDERLLKDRNQQGQLLSLHDDTGPLLRDDSNHDLLALGDDNKTAFSKLSGREKQIAIKAGYERFWLYVIKILKENAFQE